VSTPSQDLLLIRKTSWDCRPTGSRTGATRRLAKVRYRRPLGFVSTLLIHLSRFASWIPSTRVETAGVQSVPWPDDIESGIEPSAITFFNAVTRAPPQLVPHIPQHFVNLLARDLCHVSFTVHAFRPDAGGHDSLLSWCRRHGRWPSDLALRGGIDAIYGLLDLRSADSKLSPPPVSFNQWHPGFVSGMLHLGSGGEPGAMFARRAKRDSKHAHASVEHGTRLSCQRTIMGVTNWIFPRFFSASLPLLGLPSIEQLNQRDERRLVLCQYISGRMAHII